MKAARRLILASQSPRRAQLLREAGLVFEQMDPPFADPDQPAPHPDPAAHVAELALEKARSLRAQLDDPAVVILAADTVCVDGDGHLLGKPVDRADAGRMLRSLAGGRQRVLTGVALLLPEKSATAPQVVNFTDEAQVHCGPVAEAQVQAALDAGVWQGKAGGYNLFELRAAGWPLTVAGDETTVAGLPMRKVLGLLSGGVL